MWYALIVAMLSLGGAALPLRFRPGHAQLQVYLSLAAGALLGAALFHLLPHASEYIHHDFGLPAVLGICVVFFLQRYIAPHSHEIDPHNNAPHKHEEHAQHGCADHEHLHTAGPFLTSAVAIFALSIHSLFDGLALGAAVSGQAHGGALALAVFLSVLIHKPMDGLSVSVLLMKSGTRRSTLWLIQLCFAALVPLGTLAFIATSGSVFEASKLIGYTMAFSAGTFLAIALTDLLPELHFHSHDRHKLSSALLAGLLVMWFTSTLGHGDHAHEQDAASSATGEHSDHDHAHDGHEH